MRAADHRPKDQAAIRTNLGAIFISLELSRSTWQIQAGDRHRDMAPKAAVQIGLAHLSPARRKRDIGAVVTHGDRM